MKLPDKHLREMHCPWALLRQIYTCSRQMAGIQQSGPILGTTRPWRQARPAAPQPDTPAVLQTSEFPIWNPRTVNPEVPGSSPGPGAKSWPIRVTSQGMALGFLALTYAHAGTVDYVISASSPGLRMQSKSCRWPGEAPTHRLASVVNASLGPWLPVPS